MDRRTFLKTASIATAFSLTGCARRVLPTRTLPTVSNLNSCDLQPVRVAADREIRTTVGLRPFRPSGFVVRADKLGDKLIIHNYGHGGAGITLSWGTSKLAVDLGAQGNNGPVAVLGCGAVGLATARLLQDAGFHVTIYAKALPPDTTSSVAGGLWLPVTVSDHDKRTPEFNTQFMAASEFAYHRFQTMVGPGFGVRWMRNYFLGNQAWNEDGLIGQRGPLHSMLPEVRDLQANQHPFGGFRFVRQFDSMLIEPPIYLDAMMDEFRLAGGEIIVREFPDIASLQQLRQSLIFNCTGLGSRALFGDNELIPIRGQLTFLLPQPEVDYAVLPEELYMFSRTDGILLGGTHERDNWSLTPDDATKQRILTQHKTIFDSMRKCV